MIVSEIIVGVLIKVQTYDQPDNSALAPTILAFICFCEWPLQGRDCVCAGGGGGLQG